MNGLYCVVCMLIGSCIWAQTAIAQTAIVRGRIRFANGAAAANVILRVKDTPLVTQSTESGRFELTNVPYGPQHILITSVEIQPQSTLLQVNRPVHDLSLQVEEANLGLNEVQVVQKTEKRELETQGFAVNVIETREVATRNMQTNELLDRTVGVRVRQNGGLGSAVTYNLNGMSGGAVRIFIDGIPMATYGSSFSLNSIPPANIERIEVYKGVTPAHLADDALGGAINIILKKALSNSLTASFSYGSFNTFQSSLAGTYRSAQSGFTLKGAGFHNYSDNDYEVWGKFVRNILPNGRYDYVRAKRFNDAYRSLGGQIELGFTDVKWADQLLLGYNASSDFNEIQHGTYMSIPYKGRFTESQANVASLIYRKKNFLVKGLEFTLNASSSRRQQVIVDTVKWNYNWFGDKSVGLNGEPILRPAGAQQGAPTLNYINRKIHSLRAGVNYDFNSSHRLVLNHIAYQINRTQQDLFRTELEREFVGTRDLTKNVTSIAYELKGFQSRLRANVFGKFYQQKIHKMDPVLITVAGETLRRQETTTNNRTTSGYGAAFSYAIKPTVYLLSSAEQAVRLPAEEEVFGSPGENIVENVGIRPELSNNVNAGFKAGPFLTGRHRFSFALSGFLRDTKDKIVRRVNPRLNDAVQTDPFENLGRTKSIGFEAEGHYTFDKNLILNVNLSRFNSVFNQRYDANGREYDYFNKQLPNEPFFTANSTLQYAVKGLLSENSVLNLYYGLRFVERFYTTWLDIEDFRTPRQYPQDIGFSYVLPSKRLVISGDCKNIFDRQVYDNFAVQKPGRAFYLKLNYSINTF
ncbi:TonB-dependent receptor [Fibrivirga algicola]|uniref:TonB-dependent receptor n=1 Tax=Fibrivirga algicola TaxID=2950420 RepID=A0ABX0QK45_9BACT|nr:TonB-dependent receptor plug domain-containing protein [Fibrivirga algicola]NID12836.1 TonB-dependent receptor [Fibrivirga algicola]